MMTPATLAAWEEFKKLYKFSEDMDIECMSAGIKYDWETFKAGRVDADYDVSDPFTMPVREDER